MELLILYFLNFGANATTRDGPPPARGNFGSLVEARYNDSNCGIACGAGTDGRYSKKAFPDLVLRRHGSALGIVFLVRRCHGGACEY